MPVQSTVAGHYGDLIESFQSVGMDGSFFGCFTGAVAIERLGVLPPPGRLTSTAHLPPGASMAKKASIDLKWYDCEDRTPGRPRDRAA